MTSDIKRLAELIQDADTIVVGAGAGLSTAAGMTYSGPRFTENFADLIEKFGLTDMYSAGFYPYPTPQAYWAFWSRMIQLNRYTPASKDTYTVLMELLRGRNYFVLTTNVDYQFS